MGETPVNDATRRATAFWLGLSESIEYSEYRFRIFSDNVREVFLVIL